MIGGMQRGTPIRGYSICRGLDVKKKKEHIYFHFRDGTLRPQCNVFFLPNYEMMN